MKIFMPQLHQRAVKYFLQNGDIKPKVGQFQSAIPISSAFTGRDGFILAADWYDWCAWDILRIYKIPYDSADTSIWSQVREIVQRLYENDNMDPKGTFIFGHDQNGRFYTLGKSSPAEKLYAKQVRGYY